MNQAEGSIGNPVSAGWQGQAVSRGFRALLVAVPVAVYVLICVHLFRGIRAADGGHFVFSLDDPYIHLALAEQIARGGYGINPGEAASPSSSALWPFLLAPFAKLPSLPLITLLMNFLAGLGAAVIAGLSVADWPGDVVSRDEKARRVLSAAAMVVIGNLAGLTFVGMEHTLQVMLAGASALGVVACLRGRAVPWWCLAAAAIGPLVRYENLGLSVALAVALVGRRETRKAAGLLAASVLPLLGFSVFLHHLGLPLLPTSVLLKGGVPVGASGTGVLQMLQQQGRLLLRGAMDPHHLVVGVLFLTLAALAWTANDRARRFALGGAALAAGMHMLVGRFDWFHRYEVYIVFFSALVVLHVVHERPRMLLGWYAIGLLGCSSMYLAAIHDTVGSSRGVYLQQFQTHRFTTEFYTGNVAVDDLGLVSYGRRDGQWVVDLFGLGSVEAARQTQKSTEWLDSITRRHNVGLAAIYEESSPPVPATWTRLGQLCLVDKPSVLGGACVSYFATSAAAVPEMRSAFARFVSTLPAGINAAVDAPAWVQTTNPVSKSR